MRHSRSPFLGLLCIAAVWQQAGYSAVIAADPKAKRPLEFHVLLIIKAKGDIETKWMPNVKYQMSQDHIRAATHGFSKFTPELVKTLSNGRIVWKPTVVVSEEPLTKVGGDAKGTSIDPSNVEVDLKKHVTPGQYDGILCTGRIGTTSRNSP
jgi:hypothetical protein